MQQFQECLNRRNELKWKTVWKNTEGTVVAMVVEFVRLKSWIVIVFFLFFSRCSTRNIKYQAGRGLEFPGEIYCEYNLNDKNGRIRTICSILFRV